MNYVDANSQRIKITIHVNEFQLSAHTMSTHNDELSNNAASANNGAICLSHKVKGHEFSREWMHADGVLHTRVRRDTVNRIHQMNFGWLRHFDSSNARYAYSLFTPLCAAINCSLGHRLVLRSRHNQQRKCQPRQNISTQRMVVRNKRSERSKCQEEGECVFPIGRHRGQMTTLTSEFDKLFQSLQCRRNMQMVSDFRCLFAANKINLYLCKWRATSSHPSILWNDAIAIATVTTFAFR